MNMFKSNKLAVLAALLSLLMLLSLMAVPAFAEEAGTAAEAQTTGVAETEPATEPETEAGTEAGTEAATKGETTTKEETTTENKAEAEEKKQQRTRGLINLGVGAVILIALVVLVIKFRAKIPGWWKGLKSECGKITWCPKDKLKKNTLVVVVIILAIAIAVGVLDFVFSRGMILLGDLLH
jgi:preprotein translocase SecE subunit